MTLTQSQSPSSIQYPRPTLVRAKRAMACAPFQRQLYATMCWQGVALKGIANEAGAISTYTQRPLTELQAERELLWLITVGVLRREVDGQGLTDSFRLTPLGRQLLEQWQHPNQSLKPPSFWDRLINAYARWFHKPSWLP